MSPPPGVQGPYGQAPYPPNMPQQAPGPYGQNQVGGYQSPYGSQQSPYS